MARQLARNEYTVGWVCVLPIELAAAEEMLDEEHKALEDLQDENDDNIYSVGSICGHNVVIGCLPAGRTGNNSAAAVATQMKATFRGLRFGLMVGIGGGVPSAEVDIRLGDVVVGQPNSTFGGVVQYDFGKTNPSGFERTGHLNSPPSILLSAIARVRAREFRRKNTRPPVHYIPFLRNRQFTGRGTTLQELRQRLLIDGDCQKVSLAGLGGIGKTQVALEFVYALKENRPEYSIFWVSALSSESFQQACDEILRELRKSRRIGGDSDANVKEIMQSYLSSKQAGKWLLVLDNADDEELLFNNHAEQSRGMANYLPQSEDGLILITTRHQEIALSLARSNVIELVKMDQDERQQMFEKLLIRKDLAHDEPILTELLDELNSIPLAMTQAASYINTNKITLSRYLKLLRNTEQDLANLITKEFRDDTRYAKSVNAIARTWAVSFEQIRRHDAAAMELFSFMSCIEPKAIPRSMLPALQPEERLESAIGTLCAYSFIVRRDDNDVYDIHSLVHTAKKLWVKDNGLARKITAEAIDDHADAFPYVSFETQPVWRLYLPHVVRICQQGREIETETWSRLCLSVVHCLMHDGRYKEAVAWAEEACGWTEKSLKEDHPVRLESQFALAYTYDRNGQIPEAVPLLEHVVATSGRTLSEDHPSLLLRKRQLSRTYLKSAQVPEAIQLLKYVVATYGKIMSENHPELLSSRHDLAVAYAQNGQVSEAVQLLEHVVEIRSSLAEDHPEQLVSQHELASAYHTNGQLAEAIQLLEHVVEIRSSLAEDHPARLSAQYELARVYHTNGQIAEAIQLLEHVTTINQTLAEDHPNRLSAQHELASAYHVNGQIAEAIQLLEYVVKVRSALAEDNAWRLTSQHELASAYHANGQIAEAIQLLEHVTTINQTLAEDHPNRLMSQHELARAYHANGQVAEAIQLLEHVTAVRETLAEDHPGRLASRHELARAYHTNGQKLEAVRLLEHVVNVQRVKLAQDHPNRLISEEVLAMYHMDLRNGSQE
ncbi:MAG: hypothetical protein Q9157_000899 [Trypethelium eluteriae]